MGDKNRDKPKEESKWGKTVIILHSGDMDKVYSALIIANGALAWVRRPYTLLSGD